MVCSKKHMNYLCFVMLRLPLSSSLVVASSMSFQVLGISSLSQNLSYGSCFFSVKLARSKFVWTFFWAVWKWVWIGFSFFSRKFLLLDFWVYQCFFFFYEINCGFSLSVAFRILCCAVLHLYFTKSVCFYLSDISLSPTPNDFLGFSVYWFLDQKLGGWDFNITGFTNHRSTHFTASSLLGIWMWFPFLICFLFFHMRTSSNDGICEFNNLWLTRNGTLLITSVQETGFSFSSVSLSEKYPRV